MKREDKNNINECLCAFKIRLIMEAKDLIAKDDCSSDSFNDIKHIMILLNDVEDSIQALNKENLS